MSKTFLCHLHVNQLQWCLFSWTSINPIFIHKLLFEVHLHIIVSNILSPSPCSGHFGLWVDENLYLGHSSPCYTFNNCCLSETDDFRVMELEVWTFSWGVSLFTCHNCVPTRLSFRGTSQVKPLDLFIRSNGSGRLGLLSTGCCRDILMGDSFLRACSWKTLHFAPCMNLSTLMTWTTLHLHAQPCSHISL